MFPPPAAAQFLSATPIQSSSQSEAFFAAALRGAPSPASVEAALCWMVDRGALAAVNAADGRVHYRCRHDRADVGQRLATLARDPLALVADAAHLRRPN